MKLIAGLGNPGPEYANTRHNCGFLVLDQLAKQLNMGFDKWQKNALLAGGFFEGEKLFLLKPQSFMNLSGFPLVEVCQYYQIDYRDVLIVFDDMDLPCGTIRLRRSGSDGGHKGMKSIIEQTGTMRINRLKIGIGHGAYDNTVDYVLGRFTEEEQPILEKSFISAAQAALCWVKFGIGDAMNQYNASALDQAASGLELKDE